MEEGNIIMSREPIDEWVGELKRRGIKTFESKYLPDDLKDRTMIIKAKYKGVIKKLKISDKGPKGATRSIVWEIT